jgi:acyl-CoA thioesterase FadM
MTSARDGEASEIRFETRMPLRHTDAFGGTPFVHGGVLLALTEIALDAYDREAGIPSHREILRFQSRSEIRYLAPLRWDDAAFVRLRCSHVSPGRLVFECEIAAASTGSPVCRMTHRYAYVNAATGRAVTPFDWPAIVSAIRDFEPAVEIVNGDAATAQASRGGGTDG